MNRRAMYVDRKRTGGIRHRKKKKNYGRIFFRSLLLLLVFGAVIYGAGRGIVWLAAPKYDTEIFGSEYQEQELSLPTPTPKPTPKPAANTVTSKFPAEYVEAYNGYEGEKSAYLTFDDGPSPVTPQILKILKEKDAPATFFLLGQNVETYPDYVKQELADGHVLANHSYAHDYDKLYTDPEYFRQSLKKAEEAIRKVVGDEGVTKLFRFPGGSFESSKNPCKEVLYEEGYRYIDWNCLNGDAEGQQPVSVESQLAYIKKTSKGINNVVILMHDAATKKTTVEALPSIIDYLKSEGYTLRTLDPQAD